MSLRTLVSPCESAATHNPCSRHTSSIDATHAATALFPLILVARSTLHELVGHGTDRAHPYEQDDLQIPSTLRPKLATMDPTVKAAFLKSSHVLAQMRPVAIANPPLTPRGLRKAHSSESLASMSSPRPKKPSLEQYDLSPAQSRQYSTGHARGVSMDVRRQVIDAKPAPIAPLKTNKDKKKGGVLSPEKYVSILLGQSSTILDVEVVKKLRLLLRNEAAR